jgi:hypothetical protein
MYSFTQTTPILQLSMDNIDATPELVGNQYMFSDGNGVMGWGIAVKIQQALNLPEVPSAVQFRMGGLKGMLSLKLDFPPDMIGIRPSMVKFPSNHMVLEVKRVATASRRPENKLFSQILLVMHHLGVPNRVFFDLQAKACTDMAFEYDSGALERRMSETRRVDIEKDYKYMRQVVKAGRKGDGTLFSSAEFQGVSGTYLDTAKCALLT